MSDAIRKMSGRHVLFAFVLFVGLFLGSTATMRPAQAQSDPFPVTLIMTGPAVAVAGQEITYLLHYELTDPETLSRTAIVISFSQGATFVSTQVISGTSTVMRPHHDRSFRWYGLGTSTETEGEIEMVVRVDDDNSGTIFSWAHVPGTQTTSSNSVETQVFAPGTLPDAGGGGTAAGSGSSASPALLALAVMGAALFCAGAATRLTRKSS